MHILRIEHAVADFEGWKLAFDRDPVGRRTAGVRRHQIFRAADQPDYVLIDLEFATVDEAEAMLVRLRQLWHRVEGTVMRNPQARILAQVEEQTYEHMATSRPAPGP